jgi:hypothetical protein
MTDYKATSDDWANAEATSALDSGNGYYALRCILELRARVEALEAMRETEKAAVLNLYRQHDELKDWVGRNYTRIKALEGDPIPEPEPIDEAENDRRFHACMDLIRNATPKQIRAAAGLPERSSLVERVALAISRCEDSSAWDDEAVNWAPEARAAIGEVAATLRAQCFEHAANWLEQEADRG